MEKNDKDQAFSQGTPPVTPPFSPSCPPPLDELLKTEGLELAGVAPWPLPPSEEEDLQQKKAAWETFLDKKYQGQMAWLERHRELKFDPGAILPGCRSILAAGINYYRKDPPPPPFPAGRTARYARGRDYHKELGRRMKRIAGALSHQFPGETFRAFTDIGPLNEGWIAEKAGIVFTGKNTLGLHPRWGSWLLLGHILSTREFSPSPPPPRAACPQSCRRCLDACPTGALEEPFVLNASKCIAYLTIEHKGPFDPALRPLIGDRIFGCDLCQETCPFNHRRELTKVKEFLKDRAGANLDLKEILSLETKEAFTARFAGSPLMRPGREGLIRNACTVAANLKAWELLPLLQKLSHDPDPGIREHARWAVAQHDAEKKEPF